MEPTTGILLVGGASRRFGSPKALARVGEKTLAEIAWGHLEWCDERLALGKAGDRVPLPFAIQDDDSPVRAPLAGVVAGLRAARNDLVIVLPVDLPLLTQGTLQALASACDEAATPQTGPLPVALRRRSALPLLERCLGEQELELRRALTGLRVATVAVDPEILTNVNRPVDLPVS